VFVLRTVKRPDINRANHFRFESLLTDAGLTALAERRTGTNWVSAEQGLAVAGLFAMT
jgi:hypothetical protein